MLLNAPAGDWEHGERGLGGLAAREAEWQDSIAKGLRYARRLGCGHMHVMAGMVEHGAREEVFVRRLRWAAELAAEQGKPPASQRAEAAPGLVLAAATGGLLCLWAALHSPRFALGG